MSVAPINPEKSSVWRLVTLVSPILAA